MQAENPASQAIAMKNALSTTLKALISDHKEREHFGEMVGQEFADRVPNNDLPFSVWEYRCAFTMVANKDNWKEPIHATINAEDKAIVERAIIDATASDPTFDENTDGTLRVFADGYYIGTGEIS